MENKATRQRTNLINFVRDITVNAFSYDFIFLSTTFVLNIMSCGMIAMVLFISCDSYKT